MATKHDGGSGLDASEPAAAAATDVSLKDDQKSIDELRQNIPPEKRKENDELKATMALFGEVKEAPQRIRDRYQRIVQREREKFRRDSQRERETFDREEKKKREEFNESIKKQREDFDPKKVDRDEKKKFFDGLDQKRRDFNADEHTRRDDFNRDNKQKNDDFNALMRERDQEFNEQYRAYSTRYNDWQKEIKAKADAAKKAGERTAPRSNGGNSLFQNSDDGR